MGLQLDTLKKNPVQFLSLTGFSSEEFDELATEFRIDWDRYSSHFTLEGKQRQRKALPRKTSVLPGYQDKLLFILVYLKTFPLQELQAATFSMTQPQANSWIHLLTPILHKTLKRLKELPERNTQRLEFLLKDCSDVLLDGVERNIQRPIDSEQQKECYSGKKKTHNVKNNILSLPDRRIMFLSQTYAGSVHDKKICDIQPLHLPGGINLWQDTGFIGHCPDGVNIQMPTKKPKAKN